CRALESDLHTRSGEESNGRGLGYTWPPFVGIPQEAAGGGPRQELGLFAAAGLSATVRAATLRRLTVPEPHAPERAAASVDRARALARAARGGLRRRPARER